MIGKSARKLLTKVPLSNNTASHRIYHISDDFNDQLVGKIKEIIFRLQLDEATDINKDAYFNDI